MTYALTFFLIGASIGSFLNVLIYRLPRGLSPNKPRRSFCPNCEYKIPFWQNIPIFSWLLLRARCSNCDGKISPRYFFVELLCATFFLLAFFLWQIDLAVVYSLYFAILLVAFFIDWDFCIIPDSISIGGAALGIVASFLVPIAHDKVDRLDAIVQSLIGAACGFLVVYAVVRLGKLAFGKQKFAFKEKVAWSIGEAKDARNDNLQNVIFKIGDNELWHDEIFYRKNDKLLIDSESLEVFFEKSGKKPIAFPKKRGASLKIRIFSDKLEYKAEGDKAWQVLELADVKEIRGHGSHFVVPREAMGFGDVKFMACIGAFTGWQACLFTLICASFYGVLGAIFLKATRRFGVSSKVIPFGPYLALASLTWLLWGKKLTAWYFQLMIPSDFIR